MKVGNVIGGLEVTDVKRVNKLNLIQFLKEVDNYLQKGYQIDVNSARQVGLVLLADVYKTEAASSGVVNSTNATSTGEGSVGELFVAESDSVKTTEEAVTESTAQQDQVEAVEEAVEEEAPVAPKKTTTRSKKTAQ